MKKEFSFAGFNFPKSVFTLPKGKPQERKGLKRLTSGYYHAPTPNNKTVIGFYLGCNSGGTPFRLRYKFADEIVNLRHNGWYCDIYGNQTIRGIVFTLPNRRGFVAGWTMGEGMCASLDFDIYQTEEEAAYAADSIAERAAESEREYQESNQNEEE